MPRRRRRVCLQDGPFLDLAWLVREHLVHLSGFSVLRRLNWTRPGIGVIASAHICAHAEGTRGWLKIWIGDISQEIKLLAHPRHFGGQQWYFVCPITGRHVSVIWKPPGADLFASRHAWPGQVAYLSQFGNWIDRAHLGKARVSRQIVIDPNLEARNPPPRPRGMRRTTYDKLSKRFNAYQARLDGGLAMVSEKHLNPKDTTYFEYRE
jgi:hypothetical protein